MKLQQKTADPTGNQEGFQLSALFHLEARAFRPLALLFTPFPPPHGQWMSDAPRKGCDPGQGHLSTAEIHFDAVNIPSRWGWTA